MALQRNVGVEALQGMELGQLAGAMGSETRLAAQRGRTAPHESEARWKRVFRDPASGHLLPGVMSVESSVPLPASVSSDTPLCSFAATTPSCRPIAVLALALDVPFARSANGVKARAEKR